MRPLACCHSGGKRWGFANCPIRGFASNVREGGALITAWLAWTAYSSLLSPAPLGSSLATLKGLRRLCPILCRCDLHLPQESYSGRQGTPETEMVSVWGWVLDDGEVGVGGTSVAGPGLFAVTPEFSDTSLPRLRHAASRLRPQPEPAGVFSDRCAAASPPEFAVTTGRVNRGTIATQSLGFLHGRSCGLWGLQALLSPQRHSFFPELSRCLRSRASIHDLLPSLDLPGTGSKSLKFQIFPRHFRSPSSPLQFTVPY